MSPASGNDVAKKDPASKLELVSWMLFDFANSSYTTVIITVAFSVYFVETVVVGGGGTKDDGNYLWGLGCGVSQLLVLISAPVVGALADFSARKKAFLFLTYLGCVVGTCALGWVGPGEVSLGLALLIISNFFFSSGENLVAAFLPEITTPERMGLISGLGWALGYVGGLGSLLACFPLIKAGFGPDNAAAVQKAFIVVAVFFFVGGLPTFLFLKERATALPLPSGKSYFTIGFARVFETLRHMRHYRQLFRFLIVFLIYNCGIIVVITFASLYAVSEFGMSGTALMIFFMVVQVSASLGALVFGYLQDRAGPKFALILSLVIWLAACVIGALSYSTTLFYVVGNLVGIAMGASQSGARALVGMFSPEERSGEFFGFWGLVWKLSAAVGPPMFGYVSFHLGMRTSFLLTGVFFAVGILGLRWIDVAAGCREAKAVGAAEHDAESGHG